MQTIVSEKFNEIAEGQRLETTFILKAMIYVFRSMKGEIDSISAKIQTLEMNQETSHKENQATHSRLDDMAVKVKEIRLLTGVR